MSSAQLSSTAVRLIFGHADGASEAVYSDRPKPLMAPTVDMRRRRRIRWRH
jgi:hypothetical protein